MFLSDESGGGLAAVAAKPILSEPMRPRRPVVSHSNPLDRHAYPNRPCLSKAAAAFLASRFTTPRCLSFAAGPLSANPFLSAQSHAYPAHTGPLLSLAAALISTFRFASTPRLCTTSPQQPNLAIHYQAGPSLCPPFHSSLAVQLLSNAVVSILDTSGPFHSSAAEPLSAALLDTHQLHSRACLAKPILGSRSNPWATRALMLLYSCSARTSSMASNTPGRRARNSS